jgi:hypothetical protein
MAAMSLAAVRAAIDAAPATDAATLARAARNALAQAVLAEALAHESPAPPDHAPPLSELRERLGPELAGELAAVYAGGADWTSHAIDALEPLHALARA